VLGGGGKGFSWDVGPLGGFLDMWKGRTSQRVRLAGNQRKNGLGGLSLPGRGRTFKGTLGGKKMCTSLRGGRMTPFSSKKGEGLRGLKKEESSMSFENTAMKKKRTIILKVQGC